MLYKNLEIQDPTKVFVFQNTISMYYKLPCTYKINKYCNKACST